MSVHSGPALFEAFNAKRLTPTQLASSFVVPAHFHRIVGTDHVALVGPRGSGKTHLLRMLEGEALGAWSGPTARRFKKRIDFTGVFVPADRLWAEQLEDVRKSDPAGKRVATAAFSAHVLVQLLDTVAHRLGEYSGPVLRPLSLDDTQVAAFVSACSEAWQLPVRGRSLMALASALDARISSLSQLSTELRDNKRPNLPAYTSLGLLDALSPAINALNRISGDRNHRWALLVDELELAPPPVHQEIVAAMRAGNPRLLLKVSFSPFDRQVQFSRDLRTAAPDQDFRIIPLWYGRRAEAEEFSGALFAKLMREAGHDSVPPSAVLGRSRFDTAPEDWMSSGRAYVRGSSQQQLITSHYIGDPGFHAYLKRKEIDPEDLEAVPPEARAAILRKIYPLLVYRGALLNIGGPQPPASRRTRKKPLEAYSGASAVFAALEGNPRWLRAVLSEFISEYDHSGPVAAGYQYDVLRRTLTRFRALLQVLPPTYEDEPGTLFPVSATPQRERTVLKVLDDIAQYFSMQALGSFKADPAGSFTVDSATDAHAVAALRTALNAGAIVQLSRGFSEGPLDSMIGRRFRLAYLLAYGERNAFPIRIGRSVNLSTILGRVESGRKQKGRRRRG